MSNLRKYTDKEILDKVKSLKSYKKLPDTYWIVAIRNKADTPDEFDDKFYLFKGDKFIMMSSGTTNPGIWSLKNYKSYGVTGSAIVKGDEWYYDVWRYGKHKNIVPALVQRRPIKYFRDSNKNDKSEEIGSVQEGFIGLNFHPATYKDNDIVISRIGRWSFGCQVINDTKKYYKMLNYVKNQSIVTFCLLNEF